MGRVFVSSSPAQLCPLRMGRVVVSSSPAQWCPLRMVRVFVSSSSRSMVSSENGSGVCQFLPQPNGVLREWVGCLSVPPPDQWCPLRMGRVFASSSPRSMVSSDNGSGGCQFLPPAQWCPLRMGRVFASSSPRSMVSSDNGSGVCQFLPQPNGVL